MTILVYMPDTQGGIADYCHYQAEALQALGHVVKVLSTPGFHARNGSYGRISSLKDVRPRLDTPNLVLRRVQIGQRLLLNYRRLAETIEVERSQHVLTHFEEYLAPFWVPRLRRLRKLGVRFHSVLHDPDRHYQVGPQWWHEWSVASALSVYDTLFIHQHPELRGRGTRIYIPHGINEFPPPVKPANLVRSQYSIGPERKLMVAFGFIRDNKNIDLVIRAMAANPGVELVVAGAEQGGGQKPVSYYKELASNCGVAERIHFDTRFLSPQETADLVAAADFGLLTYSRSFVSASGAFSIYANYERASLVSSGSPEMERITREYRLGTWVKPDDAAALEEGMRTMIEAPQQPEWVRYKTDHSWTRNAELMVEAIQRSERKG